ncbi:hypothetical protein SCHPADRAFT_1003154 [Schizopora paradoxa]|uniref:Uncharacterized protein n=1 Tax=Schizopora paradoxa TaxID=27342 RepID=A0A0H2QZ81_9AGAM|nr:hypothetical protein SCHPADRAFT_1003154 [Schizopora paradoxa]
MAFNPWGPNEPASTILAEEAWLQGAMLAMIFYGIVVALSLQCFSMLVEQTNRTNYKAKAPFLAAVALIFMLDTFHTGFNTKDIQLRFIENRNFPGGPSAFESYTTHDSLGSVSYVILQWLCDALLIWRYVMIYRECIIPRWLIIVPPVVVYLGSCATGVLFLHALSESSPLVESGPDWAIPYFSISLGLNILITTAIVGRLLLIRRRITSVLGGTHGSQYTTIAAMLIESASMYSAFSIFFIVPFALNSSISVIPLQTIGQVQGCATLLIVHRVASGKAWSSNTQTVITHNSAARNISGGIELNRVDPIVFEFETGTAALSRANSSSHRIDLEHKSSVGTMLEGITIIKDVHTDADASSFDAESCDRE